MSPIVAPFRKCQDIFYFFILLNDYSMGKENKYRKYEAENLKKELAPGLGPSVLIPPSHHLENLPG